MHIKHAQSLKNQVGFISIEVVVVLIIVAIGIGLAVSRGAGLFGSSDVGEEQANVGTLIQKTRALKSRNGYGTSGTNLVPSLISTKSIPRNMSEISGVIYNVYGGTVTVVSTGIGFTLTSNNLPPEACIALATNSPVGQADQVKINSGATVTGDVTTAAATTACSGDANAIAFTIRGA